jgi:hypothetical protein
MAKAPAKKTAVVVVHGMGEQRPMQTLWGLVEALWAYDETASGQREFLYTKPDDISGSFELRRITTSKGAAGKRFDFFEFYWAHLMSGNTVDSVASAVRTLLVRKPSSVPPRLVGVWLVGLVVMAVICALLLLSALSALPTASRTQLIDTLHLGWAFGWLPSFFWLIPLAFAGLMRWLGKLWIGPVAGDAARYLSAVPPNVGARQAIREAAVDLIEKLHACNDYDRIIVIGHSLGTVIAYDALTFAWGRLKAQAFTAKQAGTEAAMAALTELETAAARLDDATPQAMGAARVAYREAQRAYFARLSALTHSPEGTPGGARRPVWLVSDFVSAAAPLSKADVLMAGSADRLRMHLAHREYPASPPTLEGKKRLFSYPARAAVRAPHHAAVFGPTVWTNIYFETQGVVFGDVIGGPVAPLFGQGALDVRLKRGKALLRHLDYWKDPAFRDAAGRPHPWITALRRAANLNGVDETALWGAQAEAPEILADDL